MTRFSNVRRHARIQNGRPTTVREHVRTVPVDPREYHVSPARAKMPEYERQLSVYGEEYLEHFEMALLEGEDPDSAADIARDEMEHEMLGDSSRGFPIVVTSDAVLAHVKDDPSFSRRYAQAELSAYLAFEATEAPIYNEDDYRAVRSEAQRINSMLARGYAFGPSDENIGKLTDEAKKHWQDRFNMFERRSREYEATRGVEE